MINNLRIKFYKWFFSRFVSYYSCSRHYRFVFKDEEVLFKSSAVGSLFQIIARANTVEKKEVFPLSSGSEVNKIIKLRKKFELSTLSFYQASYLSDSTVVNFFSMDSDVPHACFLIPETQVLSSGLFEHTVLEVKSNRPYFLAKHNGTTYSTFFSELITEPERFGASIGLSFSQEKTIDEAQLPLKLFTSSLNIKKPLLFSFFNSSYINTFIPSLKLLLLGVSATTGLYILISSLFLIVERSNVEAKIETMEADVESSLTLFQSVNDLKAQVSKIEQVTSGLSLISPLFLVVKPLFNVAEISSIKQVDGRFVLKGTAASALNVFELLIASPYIEGPKFDLPSRRYKSKEEFVISFKLLVLESSKQQLNTSIK
ncbi:hypothetical protein BGP78_10940 [Pseudoalteromonas sp. MSK9-3]|uniref:hypothetical protein n=1 Tax=Pseudoalteromonas sp. MSK9-3 TaxID=1897633 RepID=UPI000E6BA4A9|nr:hypothetical protein [Pseudoalteromonas sp. MSK9-3]RJE76911.1 hypothetical protein BGP78_10940 [Pseudoalteromonas sp. MSK9-3]